MLRSLKSWRERRVLARYPIAEASWRHALAHCAPARRLGASDQARLRVLATLFLKQKAVEPVQGLTLNSADRALIATHACLPVLKLGLGWYRGWHSIVVYPGLFVPRRQYVDEAGVVHHRHEVLSGEAWGQGPAIVSWPDVLAAGDPPGHNVVIHEMAHKLDMLNGDANGYPPLHRRMDQRAWVSAFTGAWERLQDDFDDGLSLPIDVYALETPGEFFAVASEVFFDQPAALRSALPAVYAQLALFYRLQL